MKNTITVLFAIISLSMSSKAQSAFKAISFLGKITSMNLTPDPSPAERGAIRPRLAPLSAGEGSGVRFRNVKKEIATVFKANPEKSKFFWTGYASVGNYAPTGTIKLSAGSLVFDGKNISKAVFEFDMKTISQDNKDLQNHLRNEDFFDVEKFPKATFILEKITGNQAIGLLKIKDVEQKISFPITFKKSKNMIQIQATIIVNRTDFGIKYNSTNFFSNLGDYAIKDNFEFRLDLSMDRAIK
jgi:polyisoprenoid-binding protein YceI